jgi:subtilisin family serine protease
MKSKISALLLILSLTGVTHAEDLLVKVANPVSTVHAAQYFSSQGIKTEALTENWLRVQGNVELSQFKTFLESGSVVYVQKNYKIKLLQNASVEQALGAYLAAHPEDARRSFEAQTDNPAIPAAPADTTGADPLFSKQWGMNDIGVENAWKINRGNKIIVAVIDTGVDYTHEDLLPNMWRNPREIPDNGIDDDNNGFVDDVIGWDFLDKDNKPYDLAAANLGDLLNGGNPGHGTHCAGNVAAKGQNGKGISGVAPNAQIMALRFIGNKGGTTADAVLAIKYAVDNGAKVLSNSWGSEGEDPADGDSNQALRDAVQYAADHDVLFVAAAGNGHQGKGYDNDTDAQPGYPASYPNDNIISVAAIDVNNNFGSFSNWGRQTVDIAAPGVKVFSTTVTGKYSDQVIPLLGANWDGTSMACPHVAGAAALYWSVHPEKTYAQVKEAILNSAVKIPVASGKLVSEGKLSVENLMK